MLTTLDGVHYLDPGDPIKWAPAPNTLPYELESTLSTGTTPALRIEITFLTPVSGGTEFVWNDRPVRNFQSTVDLKSDIKLHSYISLSQWGQEG